MNFSTQFMMDNQLIFPTQVWPHQIGQTLFDLNFHCALQQPYFSSVILNMGCVTTWSSHQGSTLHQQEIRARLCGACTKAALPHWTLDLLVGKVAQNTTCTLRVAILFCRDSKPGNYCISLNKGMKLHCSTCSSHNTECGALDSLK